MEPFPVPDFSYSELHALCSCSSQFAADNHLTTLRTALHDESQHTVACSSYREAIEKLVSEGFALSNGGETSILDFGSIQGDRVLGELESLLDEGCEFADSSTLLAEDFLGVCSSDDCSLSVWIRLVLICMRTDICDCGSYSDFDTRVTFLRQFSLEELVQFCVEHTVGDELSALRDSTLLGSHFGGIRKGLRKMSRQQCECSLRCGTGDLEKVQCQDFESVGLGIDGNNFRRSQESQQSFAGSSRKMFVVYTNLKKDHKLYSLSSISRCFIRSSHTLFQLCPELS